MWGAVGFWDSSGASGEAWLVGWDPCYVQLAVQLTQIWVSEREGGGSSSAWGVSP